MIGLTEALDRADSDDEKGDDWEPPFPSDLVEVEGCGEGDVGGSTDGRFREWEAWGWPRREQ